MDDSYAQQNLLAQVYELAALRHALRRLETEVRILLEQAERNAACGGAPPSLIAKASGLTPGRITQILARPTDSDHSPHALHKIAAPILGWPADALTRHRADFPGVMTFPPYPAPRART